ncbi:Uncharacterised protein [Halioglobus japonicus]|nr:Uncharacterised protein [Halioglobus japonicus]
MKEITSVHHIGLRVRCLDISRNFYEKLRFVFLAGSVGPEPAAIFEHPSGVNINLILNASDEAPKNNVLMDNSIKLSGDTHVGSEISDYGSAEQKIEAMGMAITGQVQLEGARFFFIRDPDGDVIEFHQPARR